MGKRVKIHASSRADMNGKCGVATDFHLHDVKGNWRYTVKLDGGEAFKLKPANVRAEGARAAGVGAKQRERGRRDVGRSGRKL